MVGAPGFEPGASCAQGRRATRLRYAPTMNCTRDFNVLWTLLQFNLAINRPPNHQRPYPRNLFDPTTI
jgi:hypothetical protein